MTLRPLSWEGDLPDEVDKATPNFSCGNWMARCALPDGLPTEIRFQEAVPLGEARDGQIRFHRSIRAVGGPWYGPCQVDHSLDGL